MKKLFSKMLVLTMIVALMPLSVVASASSGPANFAATSVTSNSVSLAWDAYSFDGTPAGCYLAVKRLVTDSNDVSYAQQWVEGTIATFSGLPASTAHNFWVTAYSSADCNSTRSATTSSPSMISATTTQPPDTQAPTAPTKVHIVNALDSSVTIGWAASTDNVGVVKYYVYEQNIGLMAVTSLTSVTIPQLTPDNGYAFYVIAEDAAGNKSQPSGYADVNTATVQQVFTDVSLSPDNKVIKLTFDEPVYLNTAAFTAVKNAITINKNAVSDTSSFEPLGLNDRAAIVKNVIEIKLAAPLTTEYNEVEIAGEALKDLSGNLSDIIKTSRFSADIVGPKIVKSSIDPTNKVITIDFNEQLYVVNTTTKDALNSAVSISTNADAESPSYQAVGTSGKIAVKKNSLVITLNAALTTTYNKVKINAGALRDIAKNNNTEAYTHMVTPDVSAPVALNTSVSSDNKKITIEFDRVISAGSNAKNALKDAVTIARGGQNFVALAATDKVLAASKTVTITLTTALSGSNNNIKIAAGALKSPRGILSGEFVSENLAADSSAPTVDPNGLVVATSKVGKDSKHTVTIKVKLTEQAKLSLPAKTTLKSAITVKLGESLTFRALGAQDVVTFKGDELTIQVVMDNGLSGSANEIKIASGIFSDAAGNKSAEITSNTFGLYEDSKKPGLR